MGFTLESAPAAKADINEQHGDRRVQVDGGKGGGGGSGGQNGGDGGRGAAPGGIGLQDVHLFARIGGGDGGIGGEGKKGDGGRGGRGDATHFGEKPFLVDWELGIVDGKAIPLPIMKTTDFCEQYCLGDKILQRLEGEYMTVGGLLEASAADLQAVKCSKGQINDIKGALKAFLSANSAVVNS